MAVLENKVNTIYSKSTMFLVVSCLKDQLKDRKDLKAKIGKIFIALLETTPIPVIQ